MSRKYNYAVVIGRFQPLTNAHVQLISKALEVADSVIVVIGSANKPRDIDNPFTVVERSKMIFDAFDPNKNLYTIAIQDKLYSNAEWAAEVQKQVQSYCSGSIAIVGFKKDDSSFYLDMFPQWGFVEVEQFNAPDGTRLDATTVREVMFSKPEDITDSNIPASTKNFIFQFIIKNQDEFFRLKREYEYVQMYKKSWESAPYPVNLVCVDAVVVRSGHVLMVTRGAAPGEGLLALPGGYLNVNETFEDGMIRELREETKLKVPDKVLRGSIKRSDIFDNPRRSIRGRVITRAYLIDLGNGPLDKVKGSDDAKKAEWVPLGKLDQSKIFEDHYSIIMKLVGSI